VALVTQLKANDVYLIARSVAVKDELSATGHPEWRVKHARGQPCRDQGQLAWLDPFCQGGWTCRIDLAEEAARGDAITGFLEAARKRLARHHVFLSADIFGDVAWSDYAFDKRGFGAAEIRAQIDAAESAGSDGWMLWNPRNTDTAEDLHPRSRHNLSLAYGTHQPADHHR
jgi:hypothetical protein